MTEPGEGIVYFNRDLFAHQEATLPLQDSGVQLGLTVFDNFAFSKSKVFCLDAHLDRFLNSRKMVRLDSVPHTCPEFEHIVVDDDSAPRTRGRQRPAARRKPAALARRAGPVRMDSHRWCAMPPR